MKTLYWIDDTHDAGKPPNAAAQKRLKQGLKVSLAVEAMKDRQQFSKFLPAIDAKKTAGVIMDYQLTKVGENGQMAYGSTWAAEIRAAHPSVPVIGISHERERDIPKLRLESFLAFFPREQLLGPHPPLKDLLALLAGYSETFQMLKKHDGKAGADIICALVKPPPQAADLIAAAVPTSLRDQWDDETPHLAGRWIWHDLQGRPGFLFDELGIATHFGLNLEGFKLVESKFHAARYTGAFASDGRPRWWVNVTRSIFEKLIGEQTIGPISSSREKLLRAVGIRPAEWQRFLARAYPRKNYDEIPDCVAYRDDEREQDARVQALFKETLVDDKDVNPPFGFEARRIFEKPKTK